MEVLNILLSYPNYLILFAGLLAFFVSLKIYPAIIYLSTTKNLMDVPGSRSMHTLQTPTLGGIGVFLAFALTLILSSIVLNLSQPDFIRMVSLLGGTILLLFLGIKDDLLVLSPQKKIGGQILVSAIVVILTDVRIYDLAGIFGVGELSTFFSIVLSIFLFVFVINAFNLTDGIDGLSASVAIIASTIFGIYFALNAMILMALVSFILIGALACFLKFNLSKSQKIFMGDSGSMFVGFILAFQALSFIGSQTLANLNFTFEHPELIALTVLSYPILDTCRVFLVRILRGKSPFAADRSHIHHKFLDLGFDHLTSTLIICFVNAFLVALAFFIDLSNLNVHFQFAFLFISAPLLYLFAFYLKIKKGTVHIYMPKFSNYSQASAQ